MNYLQFQQINEIVNYYRMSTMQLNKLLFMLGIQDQVDGVWEVNDEYKQDELKLMVTTSKNIYENKKIISVARFNAWTKDVIKSIYNELKEHEILSQVDK